MSDPTKPLRPRCDGCEYWQRMMGDVKGKCRRYPPTPHNGYASSVPETSQDQWCGEFKARVAEPLPPAPNKKREIKA